MALVGGGRLKGRGACGVSSLGVNAPTFPDPLGKRATPRRTCGAGRRRQSLLPPLLPAPAPPRSQLLRKFLGLDPTCPKKVYPPVTCTAVQGKGRWQESSDSRPGAHSSRLHIWVFHFGGGLWDRTNPGNRKKKKKYGL